MASKNTFGVVLWADAQSNNAVIWCEDHGNLAYYSRPASDCGAMDGQGLDSGDLVQFDLSEDNDIRRVRNPQIVGASLYSSLPTELQTAVDIQPSGPSDARERRSWTGAARLVGRFGSEPGLA